MPVNFHTQRIPVFPSARTAFLHIQGLTFLLGLALISVPLATPSAAPLRIGIHHPFPRLCPGEEPSQRDLRVLRKAWRIGASPSAWRSGPNFLIPVEVFSDKAWRLDSEALWGVPLGSLTGHPADIGPDFGEDRLSLWTKGVAERVPGIEAYPWSSLAQVMVTENSPFLNSRMVGFEKLPQWIIEDNRPPLEMKIARCRPWPRWVRWAKGDESRSYRMEIDSIGKEGSISLRGYRDRKRMWRDFLWGQLEALLLEGSDFDGQVRRRRVGQLGKWGVLAGGQQLVLRFPREMGEGLRAGERAALSQALDRRTLAKSAGIGGFAPLTQFLTPWLESDALPPAPVLGWNALEARRAWLNREHTVEPWNLLVLAHPILERVSKAMQAQWRRTLNRDVSITPLPITRLALAARENRSAWTLEVVDMDDGSLQDLWEEALEGEQALAGAEPKSLEERLRGKLPYLPLIGNVHWVVLRNGVPGERIQDICPDCRVVRSPVPLRPNPVEQVQPEG